MSNWQNENWNGYDQGYNYPTGVVPKPLRCAIWFYLRFYLLAVCIGAFLWGTFVAVQAIRNHGSQPQTQQPLTTNQHQQHLRTRKDHSR